MVASELLVFLFGISGLSKNLVATSYLLMDNSYSSIFIFSASDKLYPSPIGISQKGMFLI